MSCENAYMSLSSLHFEFTSPIFFSLYLSQTYSFSGGNQGTGDLAATVDTEPVEDLDQPSPSGSYVSLVVVMALGFVLVIMVVSGLAMVFCGRRKAR